MPPMLAAFIEKGDHARIMAVDLTPYFKEYEALAKMANEVFERVKKSYAGSVKCEEKCADCCYALFDLTLIEALYINFKFNQKIEGTQKNELLEAANRSDRRIHKLKRKAYQDLKAGKSEGMILEEMALERVRCPLLNKKALCELYEFRPLTCRFYGIPTAIGGAGHTCGWSGFRRGEQYPTVNLDAVHSKLQQISARLLRDMRSRNIRLADLLVPLPMALITVYDDAYLGIGEENAEDELPPQRRKGRR